MAFLVACSLVSLSAGLPASAAVLLITAVMVQAVGELRHCAAGYEVSFALAPRHAAGQCFGVSGLVAGLVEVFLRV
ncbi:hypothetical protein ACF081_34240 [Streptomyces longwoodensis]|uniref:hypothetical protein n=1 Tax=Streptomyces longwoodensis TaxID=68231 RepID=UPI003702224B